jgi:ATP-dependent helicase/nuclease subunit A
MAATDAVRLLTVHGAKGLEADLVLLLDTHTMPQKAQNMGALVKWPGEAPVPERFVFMASEKHPPACAAVDLAQELAARQREDINGLYVATTRARRELVLSSIALAHPNPHSWWERLEAHCETIEPAPPDVHLDDATPATFSMLRLPEVAPLVALARPSARTRSPDSQASAFGQVMHRLLEWAQPGVALPATAVHAAAREFALDLANAHEAARRAELIRAGAGGWAWDDAQIDWQGNEVTLFHSGQVLRLDRLVRHRHSGAWWVLDYKSAARPERDPELIAQLQRYREAVRNAYPGEEVHAAFLTGQGELTKLE